MAQSATIQFNGSPVGTQLEELLMSSGIEPGSDASYQLCKIIYMYHPMGAKMVEFPIDMAMSRRRIITVQKSPGDAIVDQFNLIWDKMKCDHHIKNLAKTSAIYGIASVAYLVDGIESDKAIPLEQLAGKCIEFNIFDPLNTAGSLVLNQLPLSKDFQKPQIVAVNGTKFHPTRTCVLMNEEPIYISFTTSAFGFVGRSVYQRALYPLKTFIQTMITDDMVTRKAGVLIAKQKSAGSFVDNIMQSMAGFKRTMLNIAETGNTISIDIDESIETLNMQNIDKAMITARKNCIENIALAEQMPAKVLNAETFAEGFGEGTEDSKNIARYVQNRQTMLQPVFNWFDQLVMYCAWTPEFYETIQMQFPDEYGSISYISAFNDWKNSFKIEWPNFLIESDEEKIKTEEVKLKAIISLLEKLLPELDPGNKAVLIQWACDNFNEQELLFKHPMNIDIEFLKKYFEEDHQNRMEAQKSMNSDGGLGNLG